MDADVKELEEWREIIDCGDWAVANLWREFSNERMEVTPQTIKYFMAWLIRWETRYVDWEDENPPRKSKSSLPKMGVDGAGLKMISKLGEEK